MMPITFCYFLENDVRNLKIMEGQWKANTREKKECLYCEMNLSAGRDGAHCIDYSAFFFFPSIGFSNEFHVVIMMFLMKPVRIMKVKTDESTNKHSNLWVWALWATHQWDKQKIQRCQSHLAAVKLFLRALTSCRSEHWKGFLSQRRAACLTSHVESIISHSCSVSHLI